VKLTLAAIAPRPAGEHYEALAAEYLSRIAAYATAEAQLYKTSAALFAAVGRHKSRTPPVLVLLDPRGRQLASEELAAWLGRQRDDGRQSIVFAVGPADGWTPADRARATLLLSLGPMTLPHELARLVLSEQLYRAFTILAGHPYHTGH
jgi:23S rRNA (pseudouridine1915-N3)-methyltransferase